MGDAFEKLSSAWRHRPHSEGKQDLKGSKTIVGVATVIEERPPIIDARRYAEAELYHKVPLAEQAAAMAAGWVRPWVLTNARAINTPVAYKHTAQVGWVKLDAAVAHSVMAQLI